MAFACDSASEGLFIGIVVVAVEGDAVLDTLAQLRSGMTRNEVDAIISPVAFESTRTFFLNEERDYYSFPGNRQVRVLYHFSGYELAREVVVALGRPEPKRATAF